MRVSLWTGRPRGYGTPSAGLTLFFNTWRFLGAKKMAPRPHPLALIMEYVRISYQKKRTSFARPRRSTRKSQIFDRFLAYTSTNNISSNIWSVWLGSDPWFTYRWCDVSGRQNWANLSTFHIFFCLQASETRVVDDVIQPPDRSPGKQRAKKKVKRERWESVFSLASLFRFWRWGKHRKILEHR